MKAITKTEVNKFLKDTKAQLLNTGDISEVTLDTFEYVGDNVIASEYYVFDGRIKKAIEERVGEEVIKYLVYGGLQIEHFNDMGVNELQAYVRVKVTTDYDVTEEYIEVASLTI